MKPEETKSAEAPRKTITDILDQMATITASGRRSTRSKA